jgi:hypothetical protein
MDPWATGDGGTECARYAVEASFTYRWDGARPPGRTHAFVSRVTERDRPACQPTATDLESKLTALENTHAQCAAEGGDQLTS